MDQLNVGRIELSGAGRFFIVLLLLSLATWAAYVQLKRPPLGIDDAFIFHVYGRRLANGEGLVYYKGGERVEGFSSPLWMMIVAGSYALLDKPEVMLLIISLALVSLALAIVWRYVDGGKQLSVPGLLFLIWVLAAPSYIIWVSLTLMDTALWSSLLLLGTVAALSASNRKFLALLIALLLLARPEGALWSLCFIGVAYMLGLTQQGLRAAGRTVRWSALVFVMTLAALILARILYFGYPLPNTYYAKVSPDLVYNLIHGGFYLRRFLIANPSVLFMTMGLCISVLILNLPWLIRRVRTPSLESIDRDKGLLVGTSLIALLALLAPVLTGGDHFALFRFYQGTWPIFILPIIAIARVLRLNVPRYIRFVLITSAVLVFCLSSAANWGQENAIMKLSHEFTLANEGRMIGRALNELFEKDPPTVGVITAGGIALEYKGPIFDAMGLNNIAVAHTPGNRYGIKNHSAFNKFVFMEQRPALFLPEIAPSEISTTSSCHDTTGERRPYPNSVLDGLLGEELFWQSYQRAIISGGNERVLAYVEYSFVDDLISRGIEVDLLNCSSRLDQT